MFSVEKEQTIISKTGRMWDFVSSCERNILYIKQTYDVDDLTARLATARMRSMSEGPEIFQSLIRTQMPDPEHLPDATVAFEHTYKVLQEKKPMAVWADYDVDGACSGALMVRYFRSLGFPMEPYVPDRFEEGYGPNSAGLKSLKDKGIMDIFVVDCGSTSFAPMEFAHNQGINVIIIDHHRVVDTYPMAKAFINPKRPDAQGPALLSSLCAGGLVFLFLVGLTRFLRERDFFKDHKEPDLFSMLDLVALSTVCDMMPLRHINRAFVKQGLKVMCQRKNMGINALLDACRIRELPNPIHLGYTVGPRINAGGRIGNASLGVRLLSCMDETEAKTLASELNVLNSERQRIERETLEKAFEQAIAQKDRPYLFVHSHDWHEGVLGIIASNLKEAFFKPCFVLTVRKNALKGSVRSIPGVDISELIYQAMEKNLLISGGGHPMAGGLSLDMNGVDAFLVHLDSFFQDTKPPENLPPLLVDMALSFEQLQSQDFVNTFDIVGPFGADYTPPKFLLSNMRLDRITPFGHNHLRLRATQANGKRQTLLFFRQADKPVGQWLLSKPFHLADCLVSIQIQRRPSNACMTKDFMIVLEDIR